MQRGQCGRVPRGYLSPRSLLVAAPPEYTDVVSDEALPRHDPTDPALPRWGVESHCPAFACIPDFRFQPPPLYSEVSEARGNPSHLHSTVRK